MNKIIIDLKNISKEEVTELRDYLESNCWNWKETNPEPRTVHYQPNGVYYHYTNARNVYYQPELSEDEWTRTGLPSFGVYYHYTNAKRDFPDNKILEYNGNDIEEPTYMDEK